MRGVIAVQPHVCVVRRTCIRYNYVKEFERLQVNVVRRVRDGTRALKRFPLTCPEQHTHHEVMRATLHGRMA